MLLPVELFNVKMPVKLLSQSFLAPLLPLSHVSRRKLCSCVPADPSHPVLFLIQQKWSPLGSVSRRSRPICLSASVEEERDKRSLSASCPHSSSLRLPLFPPSARATKGPNGDDEECLSSEHPPPSCQLLQSTYYGSSVSRALLDSRFSYRPAVDEPALLIYGKASFL
ncbi:hypothetical protein MHYP_G00286040 [Metynnis hypsauchen]